MATSKKSKKNKSRSRSIGTFLAGAALPFCLVAGWHLAYGQQSSPGRSLHASVDQEYDATSRESRPTPQQELAEMRDRFQRAVETPTRNRLEQYEKQWSKNPKVQQALMARRQRLLQVGPAYYDFVRDEVRNRMAAVGLSFSDSQFFVFADRNPAAQFVVVGFFDADSDRIDFLGADLISSGNIEKGGDYFETPTGVFENMVENFSYRALGTPNQEGWRGLGAKDSRVWDFGDQKSLKKYKAGETVSQMRLLMHSTDPDRGEPRLGRTDSKGCVRISKFLNAFLDSYAILDRNYEDWARTRPDSWLLKKGRTPVAYPGKFLIIGDSTGVSRALNTP